MSFWCHRFDQKSNENIVRISALKVFIASLGLSESFWGLLVGFLINDRKPKKLPKKLRKISGQNLLTIFLLLFWSKQWHQKDISKLTVLYVFAISQFFYVFFFILELFHYTHFSFRFTAISFNSIFPVWKWKLKSSFKIHFNPL